MNFKVIMFLYYPLPEMRRQTTGRGVGRNVSFQTWLDLIRIQLCNWVALSLTVLIWEMGWQHLKGH